MVASERMTLFLSSHSLSLCMPYGRAVFLTHVRCSLSLAYSQSSVARLSLHQQSHRTQCPESKSLTWNPFVLWLFSHCNEICVDEKISKVQSKDAKIAPKKRDIYKLNSEQRATNCEEWERDERRKKNVRNTANWRILSTFVKWEVQRYRYVQYVGRVLKELFANSYLSLTECCESNYSILLYKLCRFFFWLS